MLMRCPRCGAEVRQGVRVCTKCGLDLAPCTTAPSAPRPTGGPVYVRQPGTKSPEPPGAAQYPFSRVPGQSVVKALAPAGPAKGSFWVGLTLFLGGLCLTACQFLLMAALVLGSDGEQSPSGLGTTLALAGCFTFIVSLIGVLLIALGRPRGPQ